jgi:tetratricopeptide (TPR) repeat protein
MASRLPIVRQVSWLALLPQLLLLFLLMVVGSLIGQGANGALAGCFVYLGYSFLVRMVLTRYHRRGMRHIKQYRFADAIADFEASYTFFSRHEWIDRFRSVILLSASATSYREMALLNIAFCYSQLGNGAEATQYYRRTLAEFPDSGMAIAALRLIESVEHTA